MIFLLQVTFLTSKSRFNCKLCNRKTQSKKAQWQPENRVFFGENFHDFPFFMQRFCPVNNILMANYTRVEHNQKSAMTAKKSHFHDFPFFYATFLTSKSLFNRSLYKGKTQSKNRNNSRKIACFLFFGENVHDFPFYATFLPSKSRFNRKPSMQA